jgi:FKBP-type peptidyl-prolyl cis-trans isomerase
LFCLYLCADDEDDIVVLEDKDALNSSFEQNVGSQPRVSQKVTNKYRKIFQTDQENESLDHIIEGDEEIKKYAQKAKRNKNEEKKEKKKSKTEEETTEMKPSSTNSSDFVTTSRVQEKKRLTQSEIQEAVRNEGFKPELITSYFPEMFEYDDWA